MTEPAASPAPDTAPPQPALDDTPDAFLRIAATCLAAVEAWLGDADYFARVDTVWRGLARAVGVALTPIEALVRCVLFLMAARMPAPQLASGVVASRPKAASTHAETSTRRPGATLDPDAPATWPVRFRVTPHPPNESCIIFTPGDPDNDRKLADLFDVRDHRREAASIATDPADDRSPAQPIALRLHALHRVITAPTAFALRLARQLARENDPLPPTQLWSPRQIWRRKPPPGPLRSCYDALRRISVIARRDLIQLWPPAGAAPMADTG